MFYGLEITIMRRPHLSDVMPTLHIASTAGVASLPNLTLFSYASSSTLYPCERVSRWAEFRIAASSVAWSLRACYSVNIAL